MMLLDAIETIFCQNVCDRLLINIIDANLHAFGIRYRIFALNIVNTLEARQNDYFEYPEYRG